jgi:murein DD-endopeptidase MepM/ murein hydrolase activator NlpD
VLQLFGAAPEQRRTVFVERRGSPQQPQLYVINRNLAPVEVNLSFTETANIRAATLPPARLVVPAAGEIKAAQLLPEDAGRPLRYSYRLRWQLGDPAAAPDTRYAYAPPVPGSGAFTIAQAFNGHYSHNTPGSRYAIDIGMPIGSAVRAARGGVVVSVQDSYGAGGNAVAYRGQTNSIYVLHDDGTFAIYAHLRQHSALVRPGQRVSGGQIVAQSGNSGYSTGPHLHFAVLRNAGLHWESLPFALATPAGTVVPARGRVLGGAATPQRVASRAP